MDKYIVPSLMIAGDTIYLSNNLLRIAQPFVETDGKLKILYDTLSGVNVRMVKNQKFNSKSALTKKKAELDNRRDRGFVCLRDIIHGISVGLIPENAGKALSLYRVLETLGTVSYKFGYKLQTSVLTSLFDEFDKAERQTQLTDLGILPYYDALKAAQAAFAEADQQKLEEKTDKTAAHEPVSVIMNDMVPALTNLVGYMELNAQFEAATYAEAFNEMVTVINEVNATARARQTNNESDSGEETEN